LFGSLKNGDYFQDLDVQRRIILKKRVRKIIFGGCGLDAYDSEYGPVVGSCVTVMILQAP
jgi:hypothetical protein